ncbi:MAG: hypothetical protein Q8R83_06345 [Legionellaceae bacterium]|nr:hypothetical protein [Legionellaceae bacterium]
MSTGKLLFGINAVLLCSLSYAGSMGAATTGAPNIRYLAGEASYTWPQLDSSTLNSQQIGITSNGWGGRLAAGIESPYTEKLSFIGEIGGGYYGKTRYNNAALGIHANRSIDGYDALVGAIYHINNLGVVGGFGFMGQNLRTNVSKNLSRSIPGGLFSGTKTFNTSQTQILPEIKVGALYDLWNNWNLTVNYMHVFGSTVHSNVTLAGSPGSITMNGYGDRQNPTLDSVLFGLRYNFV